MKCPYHDCQKDYNVHWEAEKIDSIPSGIRDARDGLRLKVRTCKFCQRKFYAIISTKLVEHRINMPQPTIRQLIQEEEHLFDYPFSKTKFESKTIPKKIRELYNEAERCRSVGSLIGVATCLRKVIYILCDEIGAQGENYKDKIDALPVKGKYRELLKQIKWLGDNIVHSGEEAYSMGEADFALQSIPYLLEEIYSKDEKIDEVTKLLAKVRSTSGSREN